MAPNPGHPARAEGTEAEMRLATDRKPSEAASFRAFHGGRNVRHSVVRTLPVR